MAIEIDAKTKAAIEAVLSNDQRVELIPTKDGVRVIRVKREEVKKTDRQGTFPQATASEGDFSSKC